MRICDLKPINTKKIDSLQKYKKLDGVIKDSRYFRIQKLATLHMQFLLYNSISYLFEFAFPLVKLISPKMKLFVEGRIRVKESLKQIDFKSDEWIWFHCASLGEYEQAVPVIEKLKQQYKITVSFFSPSGYEQKKNHHLIDFAFYLPIDTPKNAQFIVQHIQPKAALFIKYEFWRNYFSQLNKDNIPIYMVSAAFRPNQSLFKWYGGFLKRTLNFVSHFFVQNEISAQLLKQQGFTNITISGDTRFDRVHRQLSMDNQLDFIANFKKDRLAIILGSTWPDCETVFIDTINNSKDNVCFIIAPHEIKSEKINALVSKLTVPTSVYSKGIDNTNKVLIVDTIGFLTKIYSYADIAYIGGAVGTTGLHNILEAAVFGMPIITGNNTTKFPEAQELEAKGGLIKVSDSTSFQITIDELINNLEKRKSISIITSDFADNNIGATTLILEKVLP